MNIMRYVESTGITLSEFKIKVEENGKRTAS